MDKDSRRGIKSAKTFLGEYRSFKTKGKNIYGYKKNGSLQLVARKSDLRTNYKGQHGNWSNGFYGTLKKGIKEKEVKKRKTSYSNNPFSFKLPSFRF